MAVHFINDSPLLLSTFNKLIAEDLFIITDHHCQQECLPILFPNNSPPKNTFVFQAGEHHKTLQTVEQAIDFLTSHHATRQSTILCIGGGIVTDLGGFVANIYKRGIPFSFIPTSLMAMVDAAHGGKLGVNHRSLKNYIGNFATPQHILIYPRFLKTLPKEELLSGYAEMLKHGIIADKLYWNELKGIHPNTITTDQWNEFIKKSIDIKTKVFTSDPREKGLRKILNFGHTVGHAIETHLLSSHQSITHGHAIAIGMQVEVIIAQLMNNLPVDEVSDITKHLNLLYPNSFLTEESIPKIIDLMSYDKKNSKHGIEMALPSTLGKCDFNILVPSDVIEKSLTEYINR